MKIKVIDKITRKILLINANNVHFCRTNDGHEAIMDMEEFPDELRLYTCESIKADLVFANLFSLSNCHICNFRSEVIDGDKINICLIWKCKQQIVKTNKINWLKEGF